MYVLPPIHHTDPSKPSVIQSLLSINPLPSLLALEVPLLGEAPGGQGQVLAGAAPAILHETPTPDPDAAARDRVPAAAAVVAAAAVNAAPRALETQVSHSGRVPAHSGRPRIPGTREPGERPPAAPGTTGEHHGSAAPGESGAPAGDDAAVLSCCVAGGEASR